MVIPQHCYPCHYSLYLHRETYKVIDFCLMSHYHFYRIQLRIVLVFDIVNCLFYCFPLFSLYLSSVHFLSYFFADNVIWSYFWLPWRDSWSINKQKWFSKIQGGWAIFITHFNIYLTLTTGSFHCNKALFSTLWRRIFGVMLDSKQTDV